LYGVIGFINFVKRVYLGHTYRKLENAGAFKYHIIRDLIGWCREQGTPVINVHSREVKEVFNGVVIKTLKQPNQ
jgi:hypothetical protein